MNARVVRWARERLDSDMVNDAINDAIESLWRSITLSSLSRFISSPIPVDIIANATSFPVVTINDPQASLVIGATPAGMLPARRLAFAFTYATDSGSETLLSPAVIQNLVANTLAIITAPDAVPSALGWNIYAGNDAQLVRQNVSPLPFNFAWQEPPIGIVVNPNGPYPPPENTTGDNITAIARFDVANSCGTLTGWQQTDIASSLFTSMQHWLPTTTTFSAHAYDLIDNSRVELRPASNYDLSATLFYMVKPRRLNFPNSRIPLQSVGPQQFISQKALADIMMSLNEDDTSAGWDKKAEAERLRICLQVCNEGWNKNTTVKRYM